MTDGWIKLHRSILKNWVNKHPEHRVAWENLLLAVNFAETKVFFNGKKTILHPGQMVTSLEHLSEVMQLPPGKVRTLLKRFQEDEMITIETTPKGTKLTVCNYSTYQGGQQTDDKLATNWQQAGNNTKEGKERKKEEESNTTKDKRSDEPFEPPTLEQVEQYCQKIGVPVTEAVKFMAYHESRDWKVGKAKMKDWTRAVVYWKTKAPPLASTVIEYFQSHPAYFGQPEIAELEAREFGKHYQAQDWKTGSGQRITDFKPKADQWIARNRSQQ